MCKVVIKQKSIQMPIQGVARGAPPLPAPRPVFCHNFEELRTELFKVELIVNKAPLTLTCACPNTIETC